MKNDQLNENQPLREAAVSGSGLQALGFQKNTKSINGFRPHYVRGNEVLFLVGADFWVSKIVDINIAFLNYGHKVYGVLTDKSPRPADKDWVTSGMVLLKLQPLSVGQWSSDGMSIEYVPVVF